MAAAKTTAYDVYLVHPDQSLTRVSPEGGVKGRDQYTAIEAALEALPPEGRAGVFEARPSRGRKRYEFTTEVTTVTRGRELKQATQGARNGGEPRAEAATA